MNYEMLSGIMSSFFLYFSDILSNISLTIGCVLLLSYMREVPPDLSINKKLISAFTISGIGALPQRFLAHVIMEDNLITGKPALLPSTDIAFKAVVNNEQEFEDILSLTLTALFTALAAILICKGAYKIMDIRSVKHVIPMFIFQITGFLFRVVTKPLYNKFFIRKLLGCTIHHDEVYNGFAYGVFMLIAIIFYIYSSQKKYTDFWTASSKFSTYIKHLFSFFALYTLIICLSRSEDSLIELIAIFVIFIRYLIIIPRESYEIMKKRILYEQEKKEQKADAENFKRSKENKELNIFNHDLPKNLQMIEDCALKEGAPETAKMSHSLLDRYLIARMGFCTGNSYLDRELSRKKKEVEKFGINITFDGVFPENGIDETDINTIMNNALENAVRACMSVGLSREVAIRSGKDNDYVYVIITNPYNKDAINIDKKTGKLLSTKPDDGGIHGYGIPSIENTVQKYNGTVEISYDGKIFTLRFKMRYK